MHRYEFRAEFQATLEQFNGEVFHRAIVVEARTLNSGFTKAAKMAKKIADENASDICNVTFWMAS